MNKQSKIILFSLTYASAVLAYTLDCLPLATLITLTVISLLYFYKKQISFTFTVILLCMFILGLLNSSLHLKYDDDLAPLSDEYVTVNAKICSIPTNNVEDKTKFYANVTSYKLENKEEITVKAKTLITINDKEEKLSKLKIGDTIQATGKMKTVQPAQNPSQFDYARYLQLKKVFSLMYVNKDWEIKSQADDLSGKFLSKLNDERSKIVDIHATNIKSPMLEILGGIIFGDDAVNPDDDTKTKFINSGIFHILAASGMNVTLIFGIWFFFALRLKLNYKFSIITGILLILFYTCMTGFGPPIIRAFLMLTLILIGKLFDRTAPTIGLLFFVGFLMLAYNPLMLFDIGFQLSFLVTFALILTSPLIVIKTKYKIINNVLGACMIPVIAQLYAMPLQMYYFNTFTLYSVFANIAIIPVLSIVSFIGFISSILALIPFWATKICFVADFILNPFLVYIIKTAELFSSLPHSIVYIQKPLPIQIVLYFTILISLTCILRAKLFKKRLFLLIAILVVILAATFLPINQNKDEIIFFSVGNADAMLIKTNKDYHIIDTGKTPFMSASSQAKNIIIKYLKDKGIKNIKSLIVTHFDSDHAGGTIDILDNLNVQNVYITDGSENTQLHANIITYFKEHNITPIEVKSDLEIYNQGKTRITLLKAKNKNIKTENQKSVITHLSYGKNNVLFMADGDIEAYNALKPKYKENLAVIKSGHHGAKGTVNTKMAENAKLFIISTGQNMYGHPDFEAIKLLKHYYRTDYHNAIKIVLHENDYDELLYSTKKHRFIKQNKI